MIGRRVMRQPNPGPQHILEVPGTVGAYWSADPSRFFVDEVATTPAALGGELGAFVSLDPTIKATAATIKPILRRTSETGIYWIEAVVNAQLVVTFGSALGPDCTVICVTESGVDILEEVSVGSSFDLLSVGGFISDLMLVNRRLTSNEKLSLIDYMSRRVPKLGSQLILDGTFDIDASSWVIARPGETVSVVSGGVWTLTKQSSTLAVWASQLISNSYEIGDAFLFSARSPSGGSLQAQARLYYGDSVAGANIIPPLIPLFEVKIKRAFTVIRDGNLMKVWAAPNTAALVSGSIVVDDFSLQQIL